MTVSMPCKRCGETIAAEDEQQLVRRVQAHARDHGGAHGSHIPTSEHVLARLPTSSEPDASHLDRSGEHS